MISTTDCGIFSVVSPAEELLGRLGLGAAGAAGSCCMSCMGMGTAGWLPAGSFCAGGASLPPLPLPRARGERGLALSLPLP